MPGSPIVSVQNTKGAPQPSVTQKLGSVLVANYKRLINIGIDLDLGTGVQPPNENGVIDGVFDANNSQMLSTGLYTPEELLALKEMMEAFFDENFAVDFANGVPIPDYPGAVSANGFDMYPYGTADAPINLIIDDEHLLRGASGTWCAFQFGWACPATSNGSFLGGTYKGNTYNEGDVISFFVWVFADTGGQPLAPKFIPGSEVVICQSPWVSKNVLDQQGFTDTLSRLVCIDALGNKGYYFEDYEYQEDPTTTDVIFRFRAIFTWPNPGKPVNKAVESTAELAKYQPRKIGWAAKQ